MARLTWHGDRIRAKVAAAAVLGVDATMAAGVSDARDNHPAFPPPSEPYTPFANRTAFLLNSIQILDGAKADGDVIRGQWGSLANYSLFLEIGTSLEGPTAPERAEAGDLLEGTIPPPVRPLMAPRPYLRPASDRENPLLASRIGAAFRGESMD